MTQTIDDYIGLQPPPVQVKLQAIRSLLRSLAPAATEKISYEILLAPDGRGLTRPPAAA